MKCGAFAVFFFALGRAAAQPAMQVPEHCGTESEFRAELDRLAGARAAEAMPSSVVISGPDGEGSYTLQMQLGGELRELRDTDCRTLFRSAVVVAAASVRPDVRASTESEPGPVEAQRPAPAAAPPVNQRPAPLTAPAEEQQPPQEPEPPTAAHAFVGIGAGAAVGLLPGLAFVAEVTGAVAMDQWGVLLAFQYLPGSEAKEPSGHGVEVEALGARAAVLFQPAEVLRIAAGLEAHRLEGSGLGAPTTTTTFSDVVWSVAPAAELAGILLRVDQLAVELAAQGRWAVVRPRFEISGFGEVYQVPRFGGAGLLRGVLHFP